MKVAILGATGMVGQYLVSLLQGHPWFETEVLAASDRSAGKKYREAAHWIHPSQMPSGIGEMEVANSDVKSVEELGSPDIIFSCLPSDIAGGVEEEFASAGYPVFSKAANHRLEEDVPLIIPEVNPSHATLVDFQKEKRGWQGFITTDPNCSTTQLVLSLFPLVQFDLSKVMVTTMQALSGAGYPGVPSLDANANVIPFISKEEEKLESETLKLLGEFDGEKIIPAELKLSATCTRVPVQHGHLESVTVSLEAKPSLEEVKEAWASFEGEPLKLGLPSAVKPIRYREENDRPQPRLDCDEGNGMTIVLGRLRMDPILDYKYLCLGHNVVRGAAGEGILQAELFKAKGLI
ncbi:aspartate-semialdehyde dehydrogenase [Candidatus Micrarchaeota archaeon]|nr:aspartate-semialdehyde dehydrogenase [Candidatus Micrarchaeota archaeon]